MNKQHQQSTHGVSGLFGGSPWKQWEVCLNMTIKRTHRFTPRLSASKFPTSLAAHDHANLEVLIKQGWKYVFGDHTCPNVQIVIERDCTCTWGPWFFQLPLQIQAKMKIHLQTVIERVSRCTVRPWWRVFQNTLQGYDSAKLEAVIEPVWRCTWGWYSGEIGDALWSFVQAR